MKRLSVQWYVNNNNDSDNNNKSKMLGSLEKLNWNVVSVLKDICQRDSRQK